MKNIWCYIESLVARLKIKILGLRFYINDINNKEKIMGKIILGNTQSSGTYLKDCL